MSEKKLDPRVERLLELIDEAQRTKKRAKQTAGTTAS
jgi:hypothetical protein